MKTADISAVFGNAIAAQKFGHMAQTQIATDAGKCTTHLGKNSARLHNGKSAKISIIN
jgi:hypothetical protein